MPPCAESTSSANGGDNDEMVAAVVPTSLSWFGRNKASYHAANTSSSADEEVGGHDDNYFPSLSFAPQSACTSSRRSAIATVLLLVTVIFVTGYSAGERHEQRVGAPLVANTDLLDSDDDTVEVEDPDLLDSGEDAVEVEDLDTDDSGLDDDGDDRIDEGTSGLDIDTNNNDENNYNDIGNDTVEVEDLDTDDTAFDDDDNNDGDDGDDRIDEGTSGLDIDTTNNENNDDDDDTDNDNGKYIAPSVPYDKFLVFAQQRSGSRFLTDLLDDHPHVRCGNEELNHPGKSLNLKHLSVDDYMTALDEVYDRLFQTKTHSTPEGKSTVVGFKVMYNQGAMHYGEDLMAKLDEAGVKVVHLVRRNKLLQYISQMSNEADKKMNSDHDAHPKTKEEAERIRDELTVSGKPEKVLRWMEDKAEEDTKIANLISAHLESTNYAFVDYEDLSAKTDREVARLFDLLGVEEKRVETELEKIHEGKKTRKYFVSKQQKPLKEALEHSEFAWVLDGW